MDPETLRADFPILDQTINGNPLVYFDNGATSQKPRQVIDAISNYYLHDNSNVHRGAHELSNRATAAFEGARERTARFLNAASCDEIIFTRGTTEAVNLIATAWGRSTLKPDDSILITEMEHHSNLIPWQLLSQQTGATLRHIPVDPDTGLLQLDTLDELLSQNTRILSFTHISNSLGTLNPVREICARAREHGVLTFIDGAQAAGHRPVDVREIGCDFYAFSGHKICGPTGIGALYGRLDVLETLPPYHGGGEMINNVTYHTSDFKKPPHRFEAGTPNIADAIGLHAALDYLDTIGRDTIARHDAKLTAYAYDQLSALEGMRIIGPPGNERASLVSFQYGDIHAHDLVTLADHYGLALRGGHHCNQPLMHKLGLQATARASFYLYNTKAEIDRMMEVLDKVASMLR